MKKNTKAGIVILIILVIITIIAFMIKDYYKKTEECTKCNGTGRVIGICQGEQECWLCLGKCTRTFCNKRGERHEYEYKSKERKTCVQCGQYNKIVIYLCVNCGSLKESCSLCNKISENRLFWLFRYLLFM